MKGSQNCQSESGLVKFGSKSFKTNNKLLIVVKQHVLACVQIFIPLAST